MQKTENGKERTKKKYPSNDGISITSLWPRAEWNGNIMDDDPCDGSAYIPFHNCKPCAYLFSHLAVIISWVSQSTTPSQCATAFAGALSHFMMDNARRDIGFVAPINLNCRNKEEEEGTRADLNARTHGILWYRQMGWHIIYCSVFSRHHFPKTPITHWRWSIFHWTFGSFCRWSCRNRSDAVFDYSFVRHYQPAPALTPSIFQMTFGFATTVQPLNQLASSDLSLLFLFCSFTSNVAFIQLFSSGKGLPPVLLGMRGTHIFRFKIHTFD